MARTIRQQRTAGEIRKGRERREEEHSKSIITEIAIARLE